MGWLIENVSTTVAGGSYGDSLAPTGCKVVVAYKQDNFAFDTSVGPLKTDSAGLGPVNNQTMRLGSRNSGGNCLGGHISRLTYWPARLSNNVLQTITL